MAIGNPELLDDEQAFVIEAGQYVSGAVPTRGDSASAILLPANFTGSELKIQGAFDKDGPYQPVYLSNGDEYVVQAGPSRIVILDPYVFFALNHLKLVAVSSQATVVTIPINNRPI